MKNNIMAFKESGKLVYTWDQRCDTCGEEIQHRFKFISPCKPNTNEPDYCYACYKKEVLEQLRYNHGLIN